MNECYKHKIVFDMNECGLCFNKITHISEKSCSYLSLSIWLAHKICFMINNNSMINVISFKISKYF